MKWPMELTLIRHDVSEYNVLKQAKKESVKYQRFLELFKIDPEHPETVRAAYEAAEEISLNVTDQATALANNGANALQVGIALEQELELPDVIFVSPYKRTKSTLEKLIEGWPKLSDVRVYEDERIREHEHGLTTLYNDWRIFQAIHPEQRRFMELHGSMSRYWYRYPQGENVPDVRERVRSWMNTLVRDWNGQKVLAITHHLTILSVRANLERLSAEQFVELDENSETKPINCGVTHYKGVPTQGRDGKLVLAFNNRCFY